MVKYLNYISSYIMTHRLNCLIQISARDLAFHVKIGFPSDSTPLICYVAYDSRLQTPALHAIWRVAARNSPFSRKLYRIAAAGAWQKETFLGVSTKQLKVLTCSLFQTLIT